LEDEAAIWAFQRQRGEVGSKECKMNKWKNNSMSDWPTEGIPFEK
jgi:hypothetical protein